jgi:hypothetical protein
LLPQSKEVKAAAVLPQSKVLQFDIRQVSRYNDGMAMESLNRKPGLPTSPS